MIEILKINIIAAMDLDRSIAKDGVLPWHNSEEMKFFRSKTLNQIVLMGNNTAKSLPGGMLKDRMNIVLTSDKNLYNIYHPYKFYYTDIDHALESIRLYARAHDLEDLWIIGGLSIYKSFIPIADKIYLSEIQGKYGGDLKFPHINMNVWNLKSKYSPHDSFKVYEYERKHILGY